MDQCYANAPAPTPEAARESVWSVLDRSVDQHLLRVQAFAICHALEDDLPPDADSELDRFLFQDLRIRGDTRLVRSHM